MDRVLFEPPGAAPWLAPYREGLEAGELRLPRCSVCGKWAWYPLESGPACADAHYLWEAVGPLATVFTLTRVERPLLPGVRDPYVTGLVVSEQAPRCRIPALFDESGGAIAIGDTVRFTTFRKDGHVLPKFVLESLS